VKKPFFCQIHLATNWLILSHFTSSKLSHVAHTFACSFPLKASEKAGFNGAVRKIFSNTASLLLLLCASLAGSSVANAQPDIEPDLKAAQTTTQNTFKEKIVPFISTYCAECHGGKKQKGGVTFRGAIKKPEGAAFRKQWKLSAASLKAHDMPPDEAQKQPTEEERKLFIDWVSSIKYLSPKDPGVFVIRRLNKTEYGNTLHDLLGVDPQVTADLPDEVFGAGYLNALSPLLMEQYLMIANQVLNKVFTPENAEATALQKRLFGEMPPPGANVREAARNVARSLARNAYRRPASEEELDVLLDVFNLANAAGNSYSESLRLMLKAILVSPQFLFITPNGEPEPDQEIVRLDDYQLASRLSYLLWATMPDAELSNLADTGTLHEPAILQAQVRRLLADGRSRALFDGFGAQWLGLEKIGAKTFDKSKFPQMTVAMRAAMYDETRLFFEEILRKNSSIISFIDSDFTYLNATLAPIYGIDNEVQGNDMRRVTLKNPNRGGILGMPGILATTSFPNRTSPVNRGVWVLEQVLGEHVPPPPPNVPSLEKQDKTQIANMTLRQRTELHRSNAACANCHKILDPIGFGLENFDAIGRWRDRDENGGAIDAGGELPGGKTFSSPLELKKIIAARADDLCRNLAEKLLSYALCRQLDGYDEIVVDGLAEAVAKDGYRMQTLVTQVVTSYPFTHRRVQEMKVNSNEKKLAN
jgi:mono/diheme cytochrome c family protein